MIYLFLLYQIDFYVFVTNCFSKFLVVILVAITEAPIVKRQLLGTVMAFVIIIIIIVNILLKADIHNFGGIFYFSWLIFKRIIRHKAILNLFVRDIIAFLFYFLVKFLRLLLLFVRLFSLHFG